MYSASMAINRAYKPILDELGITYPQYLVLCVLWDKGEQTIGAIAECLALESSTITRLVKRLEASGLVNRLRNPADEREVQVRLSDKGRSLQAKTSCLSETLLSRSGTTPDKLIALNEQVQALRDALLRSGGTG
jgi:DNA-binding MarR family transcriptional regulator